MNKIFTKQKVVLLLTIALSHFANGLFAQSAFTLQQAVDYAMKNSSAIKNAILDEKITDAKVKEFKGIGLPQLKAQGQYLDNFQKSQIIFPGFGAVKVTPGLTSQAGLSGNWLLADATYFLGLKAQKEAQKLMSYNTTRSKIDIADQVSKAYFNVLVGSKRVDLLDANVIHLNELLTETKAYLKQGFVENLDVQRLQISLNNLKTEQNKAHEMLELGKSLLKFQMGYNVNQTIELSDTISDLELKKVSPQLIKLDYDNRVEIQMLKKQTELNKLNLKRYQLGALPNIAAFAQVNKNYYGENWPFMLNDDYHHYNSGLWGLQMNLTIWDGSQTHFHKQQIKLQIQQNENDLFNLKNALDLELSNANISLKNALLSIDEQKQNLDLATEVVRVSKIKYQQGVGSNLEVLNAETSLKEAQTNYFSALYDAYIAKVNFEKATGTLIK